ncbi:MAG: bifunctional DNA primase/polymerase [Methanosarcinaceae archaeon]|nr:bifunctional DNA primase/polymerase [Methanosarcinaceae archaeon]
MVEIPDKLKKYDFSYIKLNPRTKIPAEKSWNTILRPFDNEEITTWGGNYGIVVKEGYVVIDFDSQDIINKYYKKFPETFTVRTGSGKIHLYYQTDHNEDMKIADKSTGSSILDILGAGRQVVGANSTHPSGIKYKVEKDVDISYITIEHIKYILRDIIPEDKVYKHVMDTDNINDEIKSAVKLSDLMTKFGYDIKRQPTMCMLGHDSESKSCFSWDDQKGLWHCFHCGKGGTVFDFIMEHEKVTFLVAKKKLLEIAGISEVLYNTNNSLDIKNYVYNVRKFYESQPFYYDMGQNFWFWDKNSYKYIQVDNVEVMRIIDETLKFDGEAVKSHHRGNYLEAFRWVGRENKPKDPNKSWVQFGDKVFDFETERIFDATHTYFMTNPIPHSMGVSTDTPVMDKLFTDWVGEDYVDILYEIIAYCCVLDYPIHNIFCFIGSGSNGKSKYLQLVKHFVGEHNTTDTDLEALITNRFECAKLYKKLVCKMGETNFNSIKNTGLLKRLCGQDDVTFESKNKTPISGVNYAKILIATNSLPSSGDTSDGYYRRWKIIDFPNQFKSKKDVLATIPAHEYNNLAVKITKILPRLIGTGIFTNEDKSIEESKNKYIEASNPLPAYIDRFCDSDVNGFVGYIDFYTQYQKFLRDNKMRKVSKREFIDVLEQEGLSKKTTTKKINGVFVVGIYIEGIKYKGEKQETSDREVLC